MGMGYGFGCTKCGKGFDVYLGVGMMYPYFCEKLKKAVRRGKYGEEHKQALLEHPDSMVDAERRLYKCKCGYWHDDNALDILETEETEGRWTAAEPVRKHRWIKKVRGKKVVIRKYEHLCPKCGKKMKDITESWSVEELNCTKCGTPLAESMKEQILMEFHWD